VALPLPEVDHRAALGLLDQVLDVEGDRLGDAEPAAEHEREQARSRALPVADRVRAVH
jgi:hypothetical protein